jgi:hypothetical protein
VTVCYAAPPPDAGADLQSVPQYELAATQDVLNVVVDVPETGIEAQEVAFAYIGYTLSPAGYETTIEPAAGTGPAEKPVFISTLGIEELNSPPLLLIAGNSALNKQTDFLINRQHSNYGYPFTAN